MELLHRNRELLAWLALGGVALVMLSAFVDIAYYQEAFRVGDRTELSEIARFIDAKFAPVVGLVVAAVVTWFVAFWREPSKHASVISLTGLCLSGAAALLHLVFTLIGWGGGDSNGWRILTSLMVLVANLVAMAIVAGFFFVAWKHALPVPSATVGGYGQSQPGLPATQQPPTQQPAPLQPTWQPHEASGGAWQRAGDAATGAGATTWGVPGQQSQGWQPSAAPQPGAADAQTWSHQPQQPPQPPQPPQGQWQQPGWDAGSQEEGTVLRPNPTQPWRPEEPNQR